ncbi:hypothetical protein F4824DRAFT_488331 [Ustulina deusta]|nr:hypothetical protein F4824DRAFT_491829 [Ustulina deusta]KAI3339053.1 hypothetical protein F4824DRAFT_488331 [Ustulina deusta]
MAFCSTVSEKITAKDMIAVAKVNWDKLAAKAGFRDGATAKAHYEPLLNPDRPGDTLGKGQCFRDNNAALKRVKTETLETEDGSKHDTHNRFTPCYLSDLDDGEV